MTACVCVGYACTHIYMCMCPCTCMRWLGYIHGLCCHAQSSLQKHTGMHKCNLLKTSVECPVLHNFLMPNTVSKDGLKQLNIKICIHLSMAGNAQELSCCYSRTYKVSQSLFLHIKTSSNGMCVIYVECKAQGARTSSSLLSSGFGRSSTFTPFSLLHKQYCTEARKLTSK